MKTQNLAILLTDIAGFTAATARQSREENAAWLQTHATILKPTFAAFGGSVVKEIGDAFMVVFPSPTDAVLCGMATLDRLWAYNCTCQPNMRLNVRVVVNLGEVRLDREDIFGEAVNVVAKVEDVAEAGEITLTNAVFLTMNRSEVELEPLGSHTLKGIPEPVMLFRVKQVAARPEAGLLHSTYPYGGTQLHRLNASPVSSNTITPHLVGMAAPTPMPHAGPSTPPGLPLQFGPGGQAAPPGLVDVVRDALAGVGGRHFIRRVAVALGLLAALAVAVGAGISAWSRLRSDPFNKIERALTDGDLKRANQLWEAAQDDNLKPAWKLDYFLGRITALERECTEMLDSYRDALKGNPELVSDSALNDDVVSCVDQLDSRAARFIRKRLGKESTRALVKVAEDRSAEAPARLAALELLTEMDEAQKVNQREVLLDLVQGDQRCEDRREAVLKLVRRKDPKALPVLRKILLDSDPNTGKLAKQNRCLVGALGEAIRAAESAE